MRRAGQRRQGQEAIVTLLHGASAWRTCHAVQLLNILSLAHAPAPSAQANGVGGSWWAEQFCAGTDDRALNVVLTELEGTLAL